MFERFSSWRPPGYEETPGSGLGLFIARAHVLAHGGRMTLEDLDLDDTYVPIGDDVTQIGQGVFAKAMIHPTHPALAGLLIPAQVRNGKLGLYYDYHVQRL